MDTSDLRTQLRLLKAWAALSGIVLVVLAVAAFRPPQERIRILEVERINVVEPDGRLALAISSSAHIPGPILEGEELPRELSGGRVGSAGMLFYNERGDEVGGLVYSGIEREDGGYAARGALTFDQFRQDQVVSLQYGDDGESRSAGVHVWDRSTEVTVHELVDVIMATRGEPGPERDAAEARLAEMRRPGELGTHRVFLGSQDRTAALRLEDTLGRTRVRLYVDSLDVARLEFLDEAGEVVLALP
ncbi:MAG: hypothetical protein KY453_08555 [Gemmatimonadetes bacterium]|nr:hypothetical protein [Gemmatimonadota bacterium]